MTLCFSELVYASFGDVEPYSQNDGLEDESSKSVLIWKIQLNASLI